MTSTEGEGSSFRFAVRFPEVSEPREGGEAAPAAAEPAVHSDVVLVVDDSPASRTLVLRQLSRLGVEAVAAASGKEALEQLAGVTRIGLVLLDADMPEMSGPEVTERIRASDRRAVADVAVIGLVAGDDDEWLARCRASGMDGHLGKPVDLAELRRVVSELLGVR